jgi:hypothetical protein
MFFDRFVCLGWLRRVYCVFLQNKNNS